MVIQAENQALQGSGVWVTSQQPHHHDLEWENHRRMTKVKYNDSKNSTRLIIIIYQPHIYVCVCVFMYGYVCIYNIIIIIILITYTDAQLHHIGIEFIPTISLSLIVPIIP